MTRPDLQRITLVTLGVADLETSRAFYERIGWRPSIAQEGVAFYQMQGAALALFGLADLAEDQGRPAAELGAGAASYAQNFATRDEVDAAYATALAAGAAAIKAPRDTAWGGYAGYWSDPDGHVWELAMNPFWPLAADGSLTLPVAG